VFTLDANIFVRNVDIRDPDHATCHALLEALQAQHIPLICPYIVAVARRYGCMLVTLDDDPHRRVGAVVTVLTPADALTRIPGPPRDAP
jgi:predicted nucleic acid-binding protein